MKQKSMLVIGMGRFGRNLAIKLTQIGNEVLAIDINEDLVNKVAPFVTRAQIGDCMDMENLRELGIRNFDVCFVCISENFQSSMEITAFLRELGAACIVSKSDSDIHTDLLKRIGADYVVSPEHDMANRTAMRYSSHGAFDYIELSDEYAIMEISVPRKWIGHCIKELDVRSRHNINVIGIRKENKIIPMISAEYIFQEGEHLLISGEQKKMIDLMKN